MSLQATQVTVRRGSRTVLHDVDLRVDPGQVLAITGANGAGKSTLVKALLGLVPATGTVTWAGQPLPDDRQIRARWVAYVPQRSQLTAGLTARLVVAQGRYPAVGALSRLGADDTAAIDAALRRVDALALADRPFPHLSAGEQQRVILARALATGAPILVVDEPTASLDAVHARSFLRLLRRLATEGRTIVAVLHDRTDILAVADQVLVLEAGRVVLQGPPTLLPEPRDLPDVADPMPLPGPVGPRATPGSSGVGMAALLIVALVASLLLPLVGRAPAAATPVVSTAATVTDTRGAVIPVAPYARIASLSLTSDAVLSAVIDTDRVAVACAYSRGVQARRWAGRPRLPALDDVEAVLAARPDLVIVASTPEDRLARLREAGIPVLVHGDMGGVEDYVRAARLIATAVGAGEQGERHVAHLQRRLARVADGHAHAPAPRPRALYLAAYGDLLTGGTVGTGFHDLLQAAGADDAAAATFRGWPTYGVEQVIALAPAVIVHPASQDLRHRPGLNRLTVRWIALPDEVLEDPTGEGLLLAAETLADALAAGPAPAGP